MYPYEHLMQKHLLYKYPAPGILLVLPPWVMSFLQPLGFIYHGRTNSISLSVAVPQTYGRAQLPLLSQQSRQISTCIMSLLLLLLQHCKRQWRSPRLHGNVCISDPCQTILSSKLRWALRKWWQYALTKFSFGSPRRSAARFGFHDPEPHLHKSTQPRKMPVAFLLWH